MDQDAVSTSIGVEGWCNCGGCRLGDTNPISPFVSYRGLYGVDQVLMGVAIGGEGVDQGIQTPFGVYDIYEGDIDGCKVIVC